MKLYLVILSALFLSTPAFASTSSDKTPEESRFLESSTKQKLLATKIDTPEEDSSDTVLSSEDTSPESTEAEKPHEAPSLHSISHHQGNKLQRETIEAQVSLENVEIDNLTDDEILFFEMTMRQAIETARKEAHAGDEATIGAVIVENGHGSHKNDRRSLRGSGKEDRALWGRMPRFSIYTIIASYGCRFCFDDDGSRHGSYISRYGSYTSNYDRHMSHFYQRRRRDFLYSQNDVPWNERQYDDDDIVGSDLSSMYGNRYNYGGRSLGVSANFEDILCALLREGPFERFQSVERCVLEVSQW